MVTYPQGLMSSFYVIEADRGWRMDRDERDACALTLAGNLDGLEKFLSFSVPPAKNVTVFSTRLAS